MIIREGGKGGAADDDSDDNDDENDGGAADDYQGGRKREKWAAVCSLPGWRLHCASVQLLMPAQPVPQQLRHTIAATLKMLLSDLSEPDPGIKFVCCKLMEVKMCCFSTRGWRLMPKLGRAYFSA